MSKPNLDDLLNPTASEIVDSVEPVVDEVIGMDEAVVEDKVVDTANVSEQADTELDQATEISNNSTDANCKVVDTSIKSDPIKSTESQQYSLKQPVTFYQGANKNTALTSILGIIDVVGEPINGFIPVVCGIRGVGRATGYIEACVIGR